MRVVFYWIILFVFLVGCTQSHSNNTKVQEEINYGSITKLKINGDKDLEKLDKIDKYLNVEDITIDNVSNINEKFNMAHLKSIKYIYIKNSIITCQIGEMFFPENIAIIIMDNVTYTIYPDFSKYNNLSHLTIINSSLSEIPPFIFNITSLKSLDLSDNKISTIPDNIVNLNNLQDLYLGNNLITRLPEGINQLNILERLILDNNEFQNILITNSSLKEVSLNNNKISSLKFAFTLESQLKYLNMSNNCILELDSTVKHLKNLRMIDISNNQCEVIPNEIEYLGELKTFIANDNKLNLLPKEFYQLPQLRKVILYNNPKLQFDSNLIKSKINEIDVSFCEDPSLLYFICQNPYLQIVVAKNCDIKEIPKNISQMQSLISLELANNKIENLPSELLSLKKLYGLGLLNNKISNITPILTNLQNLKVLDLRNNPVKRKDIEMLLAKNIEVIF